MNLSQLQYFKTLAKEEHYTRAAQILSITQPSLSHAIAQLEQELADMEELKQSYEQQEASLNQVINEKKAQIADFDSQLSNAKTLASQYASTIRKHPPLIRIPPR